MKALQAPFFVDLVVDSADSGFINISIGAVRGNNQPAYLNGVEIMELLKNSDAADQRKDRKKGKSVYIVVGCVLAGVGFLLVLLAGYFIGSRCGKIKTAVVGSKSESNLDLNLRVPFADILQATNNFDEKLMIGRGGFGKVYKGNLYGTKVAVKRGEQGHGQGRLEFVTEIMVLSKIRYKHLVSLIGYCDENDEMLLVYEFMEKGTLQDHLYEKPDEPRLSWKQRLEICINATRGLDYLHTGLKVGIIHRDVKSTNILLNERYVASVADFGISLLDNVDEGEMSTVKGSFGYLDPEYIRCMKLTQKSDVYSFGVVLLEVLCARPALDHTFPPKEVNLAKWAIKHIKNGNIEKIIDPFLAGTINSDSLRKFVEITEKCLKDTGDERPSMVNVLRYLEYVLKLHLGLVDQELQHVIDHMSSGYNDDSDVNGDSV
ncbi:hypothetical protein L1887_36201 [Cichorium endivia]|nr:hypothetical protein L1887_36201 [Cichorium endivia]